MKSRPAESITFAGGAALLAAHFLGVGNDYVAPIGMALAALPAGVTWLVGHGGIVGIFRALWRGQ